MDKYINTERLKEWFRGRDKDLFSVDTICAVIDLFPENETIGGERRHNTFPRYTVRDRDGAYVSLDFAWENGCAEVRGGAINTLADYEDTGLTPLEVMEMVKEGKNGIG